MEVPIEGIADMVGSLFTGLVKRGVPEDYALTLTRVVLEHLLEAGREFMLRESKGGHDAPR